MGIKQLKETRGVYDLDGLTEEDVVIVPAFGAEVKVLNRLKEIGCFQVDTTCGDVMSVWKRVRALPQPGHDLHHPRQGLARGNQGHRLAGDQRKGRHALSRRLHARRDRLRLRLHPQGRQQGGVPQEIRGRLFAMASIPTSISSRRRG